MDYLWSPSNISTALPHVLEEINNEIEYVWYVGLMGYIKSDSDNFFPPIS